METNVALKAICGMGFDRKSLGGFREGVIITNRASSKKVNIIRQTVTQDFLVELGATSNTTLQILFVRGVPPPLYKFFSGKEGVTD